MIPVEYKTSVRIRNVSGEPIILDRLLITPPIVELARANDLVTKNQERAATWYPTSMGGELPEGIFIVIHPMAERTFALHRLADFENVSGETKVTIRLRWKNTHKPIPFSRYVTIKTNVQEIRNLREASLAGKA